METFRQEKQQQLPDLVFVLAAMTNEEGFDVYAVDTNGGEDGKLSIRILFNFKTSDPKIYSGDLGIVVCGSNLCAVGSAFDRSLHRFSREFLMFDLTNWKLGDAESFKPAKKKSPKPTGSKPNPVVFAIDDRLYALAGVSHTCGQHDLPDPIFEVFNPYDDDCPSWKALQSPPFKNVYSDTSRYLFGHKVVGKKLYVVLRNKKQQDIFYSYSVVDDEWEELINIDTLDPFRANLTLYGHYLLWHADEDFDGDLMAFHLSGTRVLAQDLKAKVDSRRIRWDPSAYPSFIDPFHYPPSTPEGDYPFLQVYGLEHIYELDGVRGSTSGLVAHLAGNTFCVVYSFCDHRKIHRIHACKFELSKRHGLLVKILGCANAISDDWTRSFQYQWGKMESKSCGIQRAI